MRMTAATLPASDFLPVRVELRSVPAHGERVDSQLPCGWPGSDDELVSLIKSFPATPLLLWIDSASSCRPRAGAGRSSWRS